MEEEMTERLELETLEVETLLVEADMEPVKVVVSPRFIAAKQRDLAIEVAKKQGGLK